MPRVVVGKDKEKETPAQRRAREARESAMAAAAESGPARRGEDDERDPRPAVSATFQSPTTTTTQSAGREQLPVQKVTDAPQQQGAETAVVKPAIILPDPNAKPEDQLAVCERAIHSAMARWKKKVDGATEELFSEAGPYICWVHENKLYKLMRGNDGKLYRSFPKYLKEQHGLPERTGYRITQTIPLLDILRGAGYLVDDLSSRQVDKLHPVRLQHGADAVVKVWATASETKKGPQPTPDELERAKQLLGFATKPDTDEAKELASGPDAGAVVERATKLLVPATVREAVRKDPARVQLLHRILGEALAEAGLPVD